MRQMLPDFAVARPQLTHDLLIDVFQEPLASVENVVVYLGPEARPAIVEFGVDLCLVARFLNDFQNPSFDVDASLDNAQHLVARPKHASKEFELLVKQLEYTLLGAILEVQKINDGHVDLLAVPVTPADALFDALRIPGQVEIDDQRTELKVDSFRSRFCCDQEDLRSRKVSTMAAFMSAVFEPDIASVFRWRSSQSR